MYKYHNVLLHIYNSIFAITIYVLMWKFGVLVIMILQLLYTSINRYCHYHSFSGNLIVIFVKATFSDAISQFLCFNDLHQVETFFQLKQYQQETATQKV